MGWQDYPSHVWGRSADRTSASTPDTGFAITHAIIRSFAIIHATTIDHLPNSCR